MLREKNAQGMPITIIVAAVIGLIIIVVMVMLLTGKLGAFGKGVESAASCETTCKAIGADSGSGFQKDLCKDYNDGIKTTRRKIISGTYPDVDKDGVCCCKWEPT